MFRDMTLANEGLSKKEYMRRKHELSATIMSRVFHDVPSDESAERAQLALMLEVTAFPKPGNVDRCHDYPDTRLEHFLASVIFSRPSLEEAASGRGRIGEIIGHAARQTNVHNGGNTHFGAFILLIPLLYGGDIEGAKRAVVRTDVSDAVAFYKAFALTRSG